MIPRWDGHCQEARTCWRRSKRRMSWVKCVAKRCLLGGGNPQKGHLFGVTTFTFWGDNRLLSGDAKGEIRLWDLSQKTTLLRWQGHRAAIRELLILSKTQFFSVGADGRLILWDLKSKSRQEWNLHTDFAECRLSPDRQWLALATREHSVVFFSLRTKRWKQLLTLKKAINGIDFHPTGRWLATASDDRLIRLWHITFPKKQTLFPHLTLKAFLRGHRGWIRRVRFAPDGRTLASSSFDQSIRIWNLKGQPLRLLGQPLDIFSSKPHTFSLAPSVQWNRHFSQKSDISDLAIAPSGKLALSTGHRSFFLALPDDGMTAKLWHYSSGRLICNLKGHRLGLTRGHFAPHLPLFATSSEDGTIRLYRY